ncbi:hypothetical protein OC835_006097 [Tilletia horrida]|nr:hypothetical protein OC835_006097 [Tilletia horrida]
MMATALKGDDHPINQAGWSDAYPPAAHAEPFDVLEPATLASWIQHQHQHQQQSDDRQSSKVPGIDYLVVDVRRADCEYMIPGAINLPAHSFYHSLPSLYPLLSRVPILVFHCGNRNTRGTRCAHWLADALAQHDGDKLIPAGQEPQEGKVKIYTLNGGYNGWEQTYGVLDIATRGKRSEQGNLKAVPM